MDLNVGKLLRVIPRIHPTWYTPLKYSCPFGIEAEIAQATASDAANAVLFLARGGGKTF